MVSWWWAVRGSMPVDWRQYFCWQIRRAAHPRRRSHSRLHRRRKTSDDLCSVTGQQGAPVAADVWSFGHRQPHWFQPRARWKNLNPHALQRSEGTAPGLPFGAPGRSQGRRYGVESRAAQKAQLCEVAKLVSPMGHGGISDWKFPARGLKTCQKGALGPLGVPNLAKLVQ